ncbi:MAG: DUF2779 domain-containing protein [Clostridia bacterium]|nr:DUF2779 domain-containing protein [Clostridia bacterium]
MNNKRFNKTNFCSGCQCSKKLYIDINGPEELQVPFEDTNLVEESRRTKAAAANYFGKKHAVVDEIKGVGIEKASIETGLFMLEKDVRIITDACFEYDGCYAVCDIVKKFGRDMVNLYLVKATTKVEERFIDELAFQWYVAEGAGCKINSASVFIIDENYERGARLSLKKLFVLTDFTNEVKERLKSVKDDLDRFRERIANEDEPDVDLGLHCFKPFACPYFSYCKEQHGVPERSIFEIPLQRKTTSVKLYQDGITTLSQALDLELAKPIEKQNVGKIVFLRQETGDKTKDYICRSDLSVFLSGLYYPLYFLDFETFTEAVPSFKGQKPYEQIPFQYSLHYIPKRGAPVHHKEFLAQEGTDPRELLAKQLCEDIPEEACVTAYNMSFEKNVIKRLSDQFPQYSQKLDIIHAHIDDLMIPFQKRWYYKYDMHGSYSIKKVLPSLFPGDPALDYHNLENVHRGDEAMLQYKLLPTYSQEQRLIMRNSLLRYCELDTFAMVRIYFELVRVAEEEIQPSEEKKKKYENKNARKKKHKVITNADVIQD